MDSAVTTEGDEGRILQFVSLFNSSRLGHLFQTLSAEDRIQYGHNYLQDFLLLSLKIKSKDELTVASRLDTLSGNMTQELNGATRPRLIQVFFRAMLGCVSALQASLGVTSDPSPAWTMAAARRFDPRLDTLNHVLLLQPQLAADMAQRRSQTEPSEMVRSSLFDSTIREVQLHFCMRNYGRD